MIFTLRHRPYGRALPLLLALAPAFYFGWHALIEIPLSYDHATHLFKAWHFWEEMLGRGRLRGWSDFWAFGFPSDELVPPGGEVWVALFRVLSLGQLSWPRTYGLAFAGFLLFKTFAAFWFTRRYWGVWAAVACAWITLFDPGGMLEGGWEWHTRWGVWPVTLSVSFGLLSLERLEQVLSGARTRDVAWAGLWFAAALLTHQLTLLMFAVAAPLLFVDHFVRRSSPPFAHYARAAAALVFGVALSGYFLVPFLARTAAVQDLGTVGDALSVVSQRFVELKTFQNVSVLVHGLAILGAWFALRRRLPGGVFMAASAGLFVLLSSDVLLVALQLARALPGLVRIEAQRMLLVAKLFWFPLAGYALCVLARYPLRARAVAFALPARAQPRGPSLLGPWLRGPWLARITRRWRAANKATACAAFGLALTLALLAPGWRNFYETQLDKPIDGLEEQQYWQDFQPFLEWSRQLRQESHERYRIAYHMWRGNHLSTLMPVLNQTEMYKIGYTPTQIFNELPMTDEPELLEALGVKYVLSGYPLHSGHMQLERSFGQLRLYRFDNYQPDPFTLLGPGRAELLEYTPERIRIRLSATAPGSRLKLHVASYPRWQATLAGEVLPIATVPVFGVEYPFLMEVPARDGELVLEYGYRLVDWLGLGLTLAAVPGFFGVWRAGQRSPLFARWFRAVERALPRIGWVALCVMALCIGLLARGTRNRSGLLPAQSIFHELEGQALTLGEESCARVHPLSFQCGETQVQAEVVPSDVWGAHLCMSATDRAEPLRIRAPLSLGSFLAAEYDPPAQAEGSIRVLVDGQDLGSVATRPAYLRQQRIQFDTRPFRGKTLPVEIWLEGAALHCFDFRIVP